MTQSPAREPEITVYHDSGCPVCRAEVGLMRKLDARGAIDWVDINGTGEPLSAVGISYREAMKNIHVQDASGHTVSGVDGFMAMWERLPGYRRLVPVIKHVPGLRWCMNVFYGLFSKVRMRIYRDRIATHDNESPAV